VLFNGNIQTYIKFGKKQDTDNKEKYVLVFDKGHGSGHSIQRSLLGELSDVTRIQDSFPVTSNLYSALDQPIPP